MAGLRRLIGVFGPAGMIVWPLTLFLAWNIFTIDLTRGDGFHVNHATVIGRDFVNVWEGGRLALRGDVATIYDRPVYRQRLVSDLGVDGMYAYSYPPHMLIFSLPFGALSYLGALALWTFAGLGLFWHAARPWLRDAGLPSWAVLLVPGALVNIWAGHFGFLIGALALYAWRQAQSRPAAAGTALAVMTVKPHMGLLAPLLLVVERRWATIAWAAAGAIALVLLSILLFGVQAWTIWLTSTLPFQASLASDEDPTMAYIYMMPTVERMLMPFTESSGITLAAQIAATIGAVGTLLWAWRRRVALADLGLLSLIATFLILPYSFIYDMVAAGVATLALAARWRDRLTAPEKWIFGIAFLIPLIHPPLAKLSLPLSPVILFALLVIAARRMVDDVRSAVPPSQQS